MPADVTVATKPALATTRVTRTLQVCVPASWVAGDDVYDADPGLRAALEGRPVSYVLAIAGNRRLPTAALPRRAWQRLSAGAGAKGQRFYDWRGLTRPLPARLDPGPMTPAQGVGGC